MKAAVAQITTDPGCFEANVGKITHAIKTARAQGVGLLVFPELAIPGYGHMDLALQPDFISRNLSARDEICASVHGLTVVLGFIDRQSGSGPGGRPRIFNAAAVIHEGKIAGVRHKTLIPSYDIFYEERYFMRAEAQGPVQAGGLKLGIGICEDLWDEGYPQRVYPRLAAEGADLLINISASPFQPRKLPERAAVIRRALDGRRLPFIYANLVGTCDGYDGEVVFDGRSLIFGRDGEPAAVGAGFREDLVVADLDAAHPCPLPAPSEEEELYEALLLGIRDYFRRTGFARAFIGLSGGIDSALVAALAVKALGADRVIGVTMPSHITSEETRRDAQLLAENLGIRCDVRPITQEYQAWERSFAAACGHAPENLTRQNKQARIRGAILMEYTNQDRQGLVVSTGNKTEIALGYCTLYGDMCGGFSAIADLSKDRVYALARFINAQSTRPVIPPAVIARIPTAELEAGQTDAANLPADYPVLSPLVDDIVDHQLGRAELCRKFDPAVVDATLRLVHMNEFKRRQAAPGIRVTAKAFGIGRRFPIAHGFFGK